MSDHTCYIGQVRQFKLYISDWSVYKAHLDSYFRANSITSNEKKRDILLAILDEEAFKLMMFLCQPIRPEDKDFEGLLSVFDQKLLSRMSLHSERYKFYKAKKHRSETVEEWAGRVKKLGANCDFGPALDTCLTDKFIFGFGEENWFDFLGSDNKFTFEEAVKEAKQKFDNKGSSGYYKDYFEHCTYYSGVNYKICDFKKWSSSDWCLFYPCFILDCYHNY